MLGLSSAFLGNIVLKKTSANCRNSQKITISAHPNEQSGWLQAAVPALGWETQPDRNIQATKDWATRSGQMERQTLVSSTLLEKF